MGNDYQATSYEVQLPAWFTPEEMMRRFAIMHPVLQAMMVQLFDRETIARFHEMKPDAAWQIDVKLMFDKGRGVLRPTITQH